MPAWLRIQGEQKLYDMPRARNFCIGRNPDCDLCIEDPKASRNHALVQHSGLDTYYLIDIASKNGCFVNGKRIYAPSTLKNGDFIRIGDTLFDFMLEETPPSRLDPNKTLVSTLNLAELDIQEITILVADIRGFTTMTESISIASLSMIMTQWFMDVSDCIQKYTGVLDKFIGDSVYARWTTAEDASAPVMNALKTACELNHICNNLNTQFTDLPFPLKIGVGINTGHAALDIGVQNTAMGDAVNLAFRLEDQSKILGKNVILSEYSYRHIPNPKWDDNKRQIYVKGKKDPIHIVSVDFADVEKFLNMTKL